MLNGLKLFQLMVCSVSPWDMDYFGEIETMLFMIWFLAHNIPSLPCAAAQSSEDLN